jgi:uncharacterized protein
MSRFINRDEERKVLEEIYNSKKAELCLVYGRRRVGKSRLLVESIEKKEAIYFLADTSENILDIFSNQVKEEFVKFSDWEDFFSYILKSKHKIIIIDEFQYLYNVNKAWPTILQRWWEQLKNTDKKIILCGSIISTIYKITKGYHSALYGRKTREIKLNQIKFKHLKNFFPKYKIEELIKSYLILGGIPRYLEEFDPEKSVQKNIEENLFEKTKFLYNEPINLLSEEFRDYSSYISILQAIAEGKTKFNEISDFSKIDSNKLPKYLSVLEQVEIIKKEIPITETRLKTKNTRYFIKDNFYNFWMNFVMKNRAQVELGLKKQLVDSLNKEINTYYGHTFEHLCKEIVLDKYKELSKIGRWWYKETEIDLVGLNDLKNTAYFVECKWKDNVDAKRLLAELKEKSQKVIWKNKNRKEKFILIAKSFSKKTSEAELIDLNQIEKYLE